MKQSVSPFKRLRALLLALVLTCGFVVAASAPASAADPWPWPHNGCTMAPDTIYGYSVLNACNRHDGCYAMHWTSRENCDAIFLADLQKVCRTMPYYMTGGCYAIAWGYYGAVRTFGWLFYDAKTYDERINTRMA